MSYTAPKRWQGSSRHRPRGNYRYREAGSERNYYSATTVETPTHEPTVDSFGMSTAIFPDYPTENRRLIAMALKDLGMPLDRSPVEVITGPEACFYGLCLEYDMRRSERPAPGIFVFQSFALGGRVPGGAVVDFALAPYGELIGVRVQGVFHMLASPFAGATGPGRERQQELRLLAGGFAKVVDVNRPEDGFPLERGPFPAREMERALGRLP